MNQNNTQVEIVAYDSKNHRDEVRKSFLLSDFKDISLGKLSEIITSEFLSVCSDRINVFVTYISSHASRDYRNLCSLPEFLVRYNRDNSELGALLEYVENSFINSRKYLLELVDILLLISNQPELVKKYISVIKTNFNTLSDEEMGGLLHSSSSKLTMIKVLHDSGVDCNACAKSGDNLLHMVTKFNLFYSLSIFPKKEVLTYIGKKLKQIDKTISYILSLPNNKLTMDDLGYNKTPKMLIADFYAKFDHYFPDVDTKKYNTLMKYIKQ